MRRRSADAKEIPRLLHRDGSAGWDLLTWISQAGYITSDLVAHRYYPTKAGVRTASYRLGQLHAWGLIASRRLSTGRFAWHLTEVGAGLLAEYLQSSLRELRFGGREAIIHEAFVWHRLAATELEVALLLHARHNGGQLVTFDREIQIQTPAGTLKPDAAFTYIANSHTWWYNIEVDRGTETPAYFVGTKAHRYDAMAGNCWQFYFEQIPTCLVVVTHGGRRRVERLKEAIDALPISDGSYRLYKLVMVQDLYDMPASKNGRLSVVTTRFAEAVCSVARKPEFERRAVLA